MELFYSNDISGSTARLDAEESGHCVRVLRHRAGDGLGAEAIVFTNERGILGMTPGAGGMLARLKQGCADA